MHARSLARSRVLVAKTQKSTNIRHRTAPTAANTTDWKTMDDKASLQADIRRLENELAGLQQAVILAERDLEGAPEVTKPIKRGNVAMAEAKLANTKSAISAYKQNLSRMS